MSAAAAGSRRTAQAGVPRCLGHGYSNHFALPRWETKTKVRYVKLAIRSKGHRRRECQPAINRFDGSVGIDSHYVAGAWDWEPASCVTVLVSST
jgi:hypothetical protein